MTVSGCYSNICNVFKLTLQVARDVWFIKIKWILFQGWPHLLALTLVWGVLTCFEPWF